MVGPTFDVRHRRPRLCLVAHRKLAANRTNARKLTGLPDGRGSPGERERSLRRPGAAEAIVAFDDAPAQNEPTAGPEGVDAQLRLAQVDADGTRIASEGAAGGERSQKATGSVQPTNAAPLTPLPGPRPRMP